MHVFIEEINQVLVMRNRQMETRLTLSLPTGEKISAVISTEDLETLTSAMGAGEGPDMPNEPEQPSEVEFNEPADIDLSDEVQWALLPDDELPPLIKVALANLEVPEVITLAELMEYVGQISAAAVDEQMEIAQPAPQNVLQQQPAPQEMAPIVGRVVTNQGRPRRTVPTDDHGYPVVPGVEMADPGEMSVDGDEDGIPSL